ncbi:MAG: NUDIX hydrolase [Patescibacteria group bacterium]
MKNRVRAIIIKDNKILLIKRTKEDCVYWVIPGGGVDENETKEEALTRECKEELGVKIEVNDFIIEIISRKIETKGQKEFFYLCSVIGGILGSGKGPEFQKSSSYTGQYNPEWVDIEKILEIDLRPKEIKYLVFEKYQ